MIHPSDIERAVANTNETLAELGDPMVAQAVQHERHIVMMMFDAYRSAVQLEELERQPASASFSPEMLIAMKMTREEVEALLVGEP